MTSRNWKLEGEVFIPADIDIIIDDIVVAKNIPATNSIYKNKFFIAEGIFEVDDSIDSKHRLEIKIHHGSVNIGPIWWNYAFKKTTVSTEFEQYTFSHHLIPKDSNVPAPLSAYWGEHDPTEFSWYPGKGTIYPKDTIIAGKDPRANKKINNEICKVGPEQHISAQSGDTVTFEFGIPAR